MVTAQLCLELQAVMQEQGKDQAPDSYKVPGLLMEKVLTAMVESVSGPPSLKPHQKLALKMAIEDCLLKGHEETALALSELLPP